MVKFTENQVRMANLKFPSVKEITIYEGKNSNRRKKIYFVWISELSRKTRRKSTLPEFQPFFSLILTLV